MKISEIITEGWSKKYKRSIDCSHPKGFSQRAHCQGRKKNNESVAEARSPEEFMRQMGKIVTTPQTFEVGDWVTIDPNETEGYASSGMTGVITKLYTDDEGESMAQVNIGGAGGVQTKMKTHGRVFGPPGTTLDLGKGIRSYGTATVVPTSLLQKHDPQGVAEGKIKLSTDPNWYGAEVNDYKATGPVVNIPASRLIGFEPDDKMNQPASKANVEKIVAGLKQGAKLPPLLVRQYKNGYQVLDGHHRFWVYKLLGAKTIPAQVVPAEDIEEITKQGVAEDSMSLHDWFGKGKHGGAGGGGWDRYNTKGERIGKCGERSSGEGKPKCLSKSKAASLRASGGKKAIAAAVNKKRRNDSNPDRRGKAINVSSKKAK